MIPPTIRAADLIVGKPRASGDDPSCLQEFLGELL